MISVKKHPHSSSDFQHLDLAAVVRARLPLPGSILKEALLALCPLASGLVRTRQDSSVIAMKSSGMQLPFSSLQLLQAQTRFTIALVPPRQRGIQ